MTRPFDEEEVVIHLSDLHIGEKVNLPENKYTLEVARRRLAYFFDKVIRIGRDLYGRVVPIKTLHIFITGDTVHNETMRGSAKMGAEVNFVDQIEYAADVLAENIIKIARDWQQVKYIHIHGCYGNHGRVGKPGEEDPSANFDRQVYKALKLQLKLRLAKLKRKDIQVHYNFPPGQFVYASVAGWAFVAEHASGVKNQLGIPYYGLARQRDRLYKQLGGKMDYYLVGHFHREFMENDGAVETLMCPSLVGMNDFGKSLGLGGQAAQMMYMVSRKHGLTVRRPIDVSHIQGE